MIFEVLFSVFLLALLGGIHCAAMCGGIAIAVSPEAKAAGSPVPLIARQRMHAWRRAWWRDTLAMHAGRVSTYMMLGAAMGAIGALAWMHDVLPLQRSLFALGSAMLIVAGVWLMRGGAVRMAWLERVMARVAGAMHTTGAMGATGARVHAMWGRLGPVPRRYVTGLAWGLVPCGMVYGALGLALLAGNAASGALVMGAFGLGTLPNLLALSGFSGWLRRQARRPAVRTLAGLAVAGFGVAGIARAALLPEMLARHGFCLVL
ncbi:sulfite exporter TauE/SafE family protein [Cupriavidus pauculus]|uniref:Sulfite exporter TauE/SafE family protein n=1 Tax=Cupriavidus pauculus TaxID=82633 RepID=A0A5P2H0F8_9BURK|nr:sulfite exporter TauE/SafE family protein [Cupriavidus pauculus]QET01316.1 sulfite exporter TauE/SafE family protein [Cupriavidus pauculus]